MASSCLNNDAREHQGQYDETDKEWGEEENKKKKEKGRIINNNNNNVNDTTINNKLII